ncbi:uncharacterized protein LOC134831571 [Culicoides brevitarsis]|uniref:uncharacterized protein LOC134831571 n=1 Tax=Culicoides brevitarsis TaxID=469753 RepID=UPI00307BA8FA
MELQDLGFCNVCGTPSKLICSRCFDSYCSIKCQVTDWESHRLICIPLPKLIERPSGIRKIPTPNTNAKNATSKGSAKGSVKAFSVREINETELESARALQKMQNLARIPSKPKVEANLTASKSFDSTPLGLVSSLVALGLNHFVAKLSCVFTESLFSVVLEFPETLGKKYEKLFAELDQFAPDFDNSELECEKMIAIKARDSAKFERAIVLKLDLDVNAAIIYYCDAGKFDLLSPIPSDVKVCPEKFTKLPGKALLVEFTSHTDPDREKFLRNFFKKENILSFDIRKKTNGIHNGKINVNGKDTGEVFMYEALPSLDTCNTPEWSIKPVSGTLVRIIRVKIEQDLRVWIIPTDKIGLYETLLHDIGKKLPLCKSIPEKNSMVVHVQGPRGGRLLVTKHLGSDMVEIFDVDNGRIYKCEWNQLKIANDFIRNLPVYGMMAKLQDVTDLGRYMKEELLEFLDSFEYRKKDFVLQFDGFPSLGVKLLWQNESLGQIMENHFKKEKEIIEERTRKQKEREAEDAEKQKKALQQAEEAERAKKKVEEERLKALEEVQRLKKLKEAEIERKKAAEAEAERAKKAQEEEIAAAEKAKQAEIEAERLKKAEEASKQKALEEERLKNEANKEEKPKMSLKDILAKRKTASPKIFYADLKAIPLEIGKITKFIVTDPAKDGFIGVCPDTTANNQYLQDILTLVEEYVASVSVPDLIGYRPEVNEMCLTQFSDGGWYRAKCLTSSDPKMLLQLVDFGALYNVDPSKVLPFPEKLMKPEPRTHLVNIADTEDKKSSDLEVYGQYRFKVEACEDDIYVLTFV